MLIKTVQNYKKKKLAWHSFAWILARVDKVDAWCFDNSILLP